jgi:hypothetical protein
MKYFNHNIELMEIKKLNEDEKFEFWVHPKYVIGFNKKDLLNFNSERNYINNHYNNEEVESPDVVIVDYLTSCLKADQYQNESNGYFIKYTDMLDAVFFLIKELFSSKASYPFAWWGEYLIDSDNCNRVFEIIFDEFKQSENNHVKNLLRIFCIELLSGKSRELNEKNNLNFKKIEEFQTENTSMY